MLKQLHITLLRGTLAGALAVGGVACGDSDDNGTTPINQGGDYNPDVSTLPPQLPTESGGSTGFDDVLGQELAALDAAQCIWTPPAGSVVGTYTINLTATKNIAILSLSGTDVLVNDVPCNSTGGGAPPAADLKILNINGSTVADVAVLDYSNGFFAMGVANTGATATQGTNIDLKTSATGTNDRVLIRTRAAADHVICGSSGATHMCNVNSDGAPNTELNVADIKKFLGVELVQFGLGDDDDVFTAAGSASFTGVAGTWATSPFAIPLVVNGGAGNDTLTGGNGADTMLGWTGDDTIHGEALRTGGNDIFSGGTGGETLGDTLSYAARTIGVTVTNDTTWGTAMATGTSGETGTTEADRVNADFETYLGGSGNDTFTMGLDATSTYDATYDGGAGIDTVDYSARTTAITIKLADTGTGTTTGNGDSGGANTENDSLANIENCIGGSGVDTITGSDSDNRIEGRDGADIISAAGGNDTIVEGGVVTAFANSDADEIDGGAGFDTVTYAGRAAAVVVTLDLVGEATGDDGEVGENDDIYGVERVIGTDHDDTLTAADEVVPAGSVLEGGAGADTLTGGTGNDRLEGGAGTDIYSGGCGDGDDTIIDDQEVTLADLASYFCENKI